MGTELLEAPGALYLGSDVVAAQLSGPRHFRSAAAAIRFAMEQAAPVSLRGAALQVGGVVLDREQIRMLHLDMKAVEAAAMRSASLARQDAGWAGSSSSL